MEIIGFIVMVVFAVLIRRALFMIIGMLLRGIGAIFSAIAGLFTSK